MTRDAAAPAKAAIPYATMLAVLGIVYGDIGTSPLYAFQACLRLMDGMHYNQTDLFGVLSMIVWSLVLIVTVKYVSLVMRADNKGEGGILALMALAQRVSVDKRMRAVLAMVGIIGACLLFGDGMITPAISVLSAIEGLEVWPPASKFLAANPMTGADNQLILMLAILVIVALFAVQRRGTAHIGKIFGPVMLVWFTVIGCLGLVAIVRHPHVLLSLSPTYAALFCWHHPTLSFVMLGAVVLVVTGAEALYADMGHFGARPIRLSWTYFVLPCLVLNYFGQGADVLAHPAHAANPFYLSAPDWIQLPLVLLATAATVVASQALISGAYSIARQCIQLGILPRMTVRHTSTTEEGQIYVPQINSALGVGVVLLVLAFKSSGALASAYGIAVTGTFLCTCVLAAVVFRRQFGWSRIAAISVFGGFFLLDGVFFAANTLKFIEGGWVPIAIALALMAMMTSWKRGRELLLSRWKQDSLPLSSFLARLPQSRTVRVPGIAIFLTGNADYVPTALLHNLKHNKVLHEKVLFVTVNTLDEPEVSPENRSEVYEMSPGIYRVILRYGFMESPNVPRALEGLRAQGVPYDAMQASYFLGRETLVPALVPKMPVWRLWLFLVMARNAVSATEFFRIPSDRVVELGVRVAI